MNASWRPYSSRLCNGLIWLSQIFLCFKCPLVNTQTSDSLADKEGETRPMQHQQPKSASSNCSNSEPQLKSQETKVINPIYIAVPVAGVCVLLALIIFAMYLLRRRTDFHHHDNFHHYHHGHAAVLSQKQAVVPHHCQCACKKQAVPPCSKGNRCTDSERSSSGSETKLFLQSWHSLQLCISRLLCAQREDSNSAIQTV